MTDDIAPSQPSASAIYEQANSLVLKGRSKLEVVDFLTRSGIDPSTATSEAEDMLSRRSSALRNKGIAEMWAGSVWLGIALLVTITALATGGYQTSWYNWAVQVGMVIGLIMLALGMIQVWQNGKGKPIWLGVGGIVGALAILAIMLGFSRGGGTSQQALINSIRSQSDSLTTSTPQSATLNILDLQVGDCFSMPQTLSSRTTTGITSVTLFPCASSEWQYRVYSSTPITAASYPGSTELTNLASGACTADAPYFIFPTSAAWLQGHKQILCMALRSPTGT